MKNPPPIARLAAQLQALGLAPFVAGLVEAGGEPLAFLAAQGLYVAQPLLGLFVDEANVAALARRLEDPDGLAAFTAPAPSATVVKE